MIWIAISLTLIIYFLEFGVNVSELRVYNRFEQANEIWLNENTRTGISIRLLSAVNTCWQRQRQSQQ